MATITYSFSNVVSEFVVNQTTANNQFDPDVVWQSNGNLFFTFDTDSPSNPAFQDVMFRRFSATGTALDASDFVVSAGANTDDEDDSAVAVLSNGNIVIVNEDNEGGPDDDVEFHIHTPAGVAINTQNIVTQAEGQTTDTQFNPRVAALTGGGFVVAYVDQFAGSATNYNAEFVIYNNDGTARTGAIIGGGSGTSLTVTDTNVTGLTNGNFVLSWREDIGGGDLNVKFRVFNANGVAQGAEVSVSTETDDQSQPAIVALPNGGFAVVIRDQFSGSVTDNQLEISAYNATGTQVGATSIIDVGADLISRPDIAVISDSYFAVSYTSNRNSNDDIFAQVFDFNAAKVGPEFNLEVTAGTQTASALASLGTNGRFVAAWQDSAATGLDGSGLHVSAQVTDFVRTTTGDGTNETLTGDSLRDIINAGGGDDTVAGGLNADTLDGGTGTDTATWLADGSGLTLNLTNQALNAGVAAGDVVNNFEVFRLTNGVDTFVAGASAVTIFGEGGADNLTGGAANDTFTGGAGNDAIDGGAGFDVATFSGARSEYTITKVGSSFTVAHTGSDGTDTITNIERVQFADRTIDTSLGLTPVYRFWNTQNGDHLYTTDVNEKNYIEANLKHINFEGAQWSTPDKGANTIDVYRFYKNDGTHFYTTDVTERDSIIANLKNFTYEGVAFQAYGQAGDVLDGGGLTLTRFYRPQTGEHHLAASAAEVAGLTAQGWGNNEGPAFTVHLPTAAPSEAWMI
ncbi:MAG TPA: hypothetical protein VIL65_10120 [Beijerinckiaceae bacterium]|jgi:Ca2+-binding RTX toxin-like protein